MTIAQGNPIMFTPLSSFCHNPLFALNCAADLAQHFDAPGESEPAGNIDTIDAPCRQWIEAAPFALLATAGPAGLDCSPRGGPPGFVQVLDSQTLLMPVRPGNNRIDSMHNLLADPRMALLFMIPGIAQTLRVSGNATLSIDPVLLGTCMADGQAPKVVLVVQVQRILFQCTGAVRRAGLWGSDRLAAPGTLPSD